MTSFGSDKTLRIHLARPGAAMILSILLGIPGLEEH
jgi:hypothetical protein